MQRVIAPFRKPCRIHDFPVSFSEESGSLGGVSSVERLIVPRDLVPVVGVVMVMEEEVQRKSAFVVKLRLPAQGFVDRWTTKWFVVDAVGAVVFVASLLKLHNIDTNIRQFRPNSVKQL